MKKICIVGLGYIGLPTAVMFALKDYSVIGIDIKEQMVKSINQGNIKLEEPYLGQKVKEVVQNGKFKAQLKPQKADVFIVAVPTPYNQDHSCDLSCVEDAVESIIPCIEKNNIIIIESTVPPGTTKEIIKPMIEKKTKLIVGEDIYLSHCPERVLPGKIIKEMIENNRIVGGCSKECANQAAKVYRSFVKGEIFITDASTAEMSKLVENTFRDVNIALANELAMICNELNINVLKVIELANKHPRVNIHNPGPGVGGHCLAIDPYFIIQRSPNLAKMIGLARRINNSMPEYVVEKVEERLKDISDPKVAIFGITYKGNVSDARESPAIKIIELLRKRKIEVTIYDPYVNQEEYSSVSKEEAVKNADIILILAAHDEFKDVDYEELFKIMRTPRVLDATNSINIYDCTGLKKCKNLGNLYT